MKRLIWILAMLLPASAWAAEPAGVPHAPEPGLDTLAVYAGREVSGIDLAGHGVTKEYLIRREIRTHVHEPLDVEKLRADVQRLENLSIFAEVKVAVASDSGGGARVAFDLHEMPAVIPVVGFLYTEENGFSLGLGISSLNLGGRAVSLSGRAFFGAADQYWVRGTWPWITANHVSLDLYAAHLARPDVRNDFNERSDEVTAKLGTYVGDQGRLVGGASFFQMRSDVAGITLSPDDQDRLFSVWTTIGWDSRDSWREPRRGWENKLELGRTGGFIGGDADYQTMILDLRRWLPVGSGQKLLLSGLASLQSGTVGVDFPSYLQYYIGGANSVRGYAVEGPSTGRTGRNQLIGTVEHSISLFPVKRIDVLKWSFGIGLEAVVFADAGTAWNETSELLLSRTRGGIGTGLHLLVPGTEMMRIEVAWDGRDNIRFHFAAGSKPTAQRSRVR
jgi:outer membrane protein insertion porin family